jgi:Fe-Mn family superoxide dismutase
MDEINRRQMLGTLGGLAVAGGWIGLDTSEAVAAPSEGMELGKPKEYTLPPLPYAYDALEPYIDAKTMMLHHDKHHAGYVKGLNATLIELAIVRKSGSADMSKVRELTDQLAFDGSGHVLHSIFWKNMKPNGGGEPTGMLAEVINRDFGDVSRMKAQFSTVAKKVQGSGWGILAWEPLSGRSLVLAAERHQNWTMWGNVPLLVLDVWEHAYYLKYENERGRYIDAFWNVVNWDNVAERLKAARELTI